MWAFLEGRMSPSRWTGSSKVALRRPQRPLADPMGDDLDMRRRLPGLSVGLAAMLAVIAYRVVRGFRSPRPPRRTCGVNRGRDRGARKESPSRLERAHMKENANHRWTGWTQMKKLIGEVRFKVTGDAAGRGCCLLQKRTGIAKRCGKRPPRRWGQWRTMRAFSQKYRVFRVKPCVETILGTQSNFKVP